MEMMKHFREYNEELQGTLFFLKRVKSIKVEKKKKKRK